MYYISVYLVLGFLGIDGDIVEDTCFCFLEFLCLVKVEILEVISIYWVLIGYEFCVFLVFFDLYNYFWG